MTVNQAPALPAQRFVALWQRARAGGHGAAPEAVHAELCRHYGESHRRYHTPAHIAHCLAEFDVAPIASVDADTIEFALWFHDVIYVPAAADNEALSAALFARLAREALPVPLVTRVNALILATTHRAPPADGAEAWVVDIDLSSFGLPWEQFLDDSRAVREELAHQRDEVYYAGHGRFLRSLAARPKIFTSEHFHGRYEQVARDNIARLLAAIAGGLRL